MQRILVADDDPDLLELLSQGFEKAGFAVTTAGNGEDALKHARFLPDLIVLDIRLPDVDGFTVCEKIRRDPATASIPVIMMTGLPGQLSRFAGLECGANDYVCKPVTPEELLAKARPWLECPKGAGVN